jgi:PAS domain S-box-containing protein
MQIVAQPLTDADGKVVGVAGMLDDVTAKRAAEIRLRDQLSFNRKLIETIPVPVSVRDAEAGFVAVNRAWEQFFGKTREEVLGRLATEVFPPSMTQAIAPIDAELLRSGGHRQFEADMHVADGSIRTTLNCRSAFAREDGSIGGIITAFIDISERKKVEATIRHAKEQAEAANAAKNDFLATVSHELRTPLSGIIGMSALVLDSELNAEQRDSLEVVQTSADTLLHIIDDIRDVARIESGEIQLENRPLDLRSVASSVVRMLAVPAHVKALSIVADVTESVPQTVEGDLHRLRQVLVHLVGNAVQFTEQGEVVLEIDTCPGGLRFTIRDTGVGMPEGLREQVERLFTGRSDLRDKTHVGGALGITVSGRLVRFIGGNEVCVQSTPGGGTNIGFRLPFDADTAPAYRPVQYAGSALIVVGSPRAREALERMLRSRGLQVRTAGDPTEAVAMNQSAPADLALVDADWTGDAGPLTAQMLHRTDPTLPVFVLLPVTGPASDSSRLRQQKLAGYVRKPVFAADLERALSAVLQVRRADVKAEELPAGRPERTDSTAPAPAAAVSQANILVAEDNKVNQAIIRRLLQNAGHRVFIAGDGQRAIEALLSQRFHLILMDVQMPHMDGLEATRRIRSMEREGFPRTPIIALTAHAFGGDRELCLEAGMDGYVSKPINASVLQKVMQQHLPGSAAGDSSPRVAEQSKLEDLPQ